MGMTVRMGRRQSLIQRRRLMGWMVSPACPISVMVVFTSFSVDTRQMPPPPMPASLDPTTVSSLAHAHATRGASPRGSIQLEKNGVPASWVPPRTPTPTSASSGRSSQSSSQGAATPVPSSSTMAHSPAPPPVNSGSLPLSTPFPPATQAQVQLQPSAPVQSHPPSLVPSVSPSTTFSKLSLHSPDASSSPHLSMLCSPSEFTPLSPTSISTLCTSDPRAPSPPPHRPSKPLHVHAQNESPSFPPSLSAPVVTVNPPEGMRDTPAEAQYQQPYRSSPDSRDESYSPTDVDKKRPANGEAHRVRFASPEVLSGLPRLKGGATSNDMELDADDGVSANSKATGVVNEQEVPPMGHDAMDVDVDVVGDHQREDASTPLHTEAPESRTNHDPDESAAVQTPASPLSRPPSESPPPSTSASAEGPAPEDDSSPSAPEVNENTPQVEPMSIDPEPPEPAREPSPLPPPKVKMSLKDFALRKKKQREEEMAAKALRSPATPDEPGLPSSPSLDVQQDFASEHAADSGGVVNGHEVMTNGVTTGGAPGSSRNERDSTQDAGRVGKKATEDHKPSTGETQVPSMIAATKVAETTQPSLPRVLGERNSTDLTKAQNDVKPTTTLTAKVEIMDAMIPSGLVGADDRTPDAVSFAPEPPPPPLTTKQTHEMTSVDRTAPLSSAPRSIAPSTPASTSTATSMSTSTSTSAANSRSNSIGLPTSTPNSNPSSHLHVPASSSSIPRSRRPSHEDGEITSSTPPKSYLPRSHTPPTQPRSFHAVHPPSPSFGPTSSSTIPVPRRPAPALSRSPLSNAPGPTPPPTSSRPLPSGPRALRGSMTQPTHTPPYPPTRPPYTGSQYIPRGPSADRDRIDWDRGDRPWTAQARSRGRAGSNGWGR